MRIREEAKPTWSQQCSAFQGDETGQDFQRYIEHWCDAAERRMGVGEAGHITVLETNLHDVMGEALDEVHESLGAVDPGFIGPMLMYIVHAWEWGQEYGMTLTPIEAKYLAAAIREQVYRAQEAAADEENNSPEPGV